MQKLFKTLLVWRVCWPYDQQMTTWHKSEVYLFRVELILSWSGYVLVWAGFIFSIYFQHLSKIFFSFFFFEARLSSISQTDHKYFFAFLIVYINLKAFVYQCSSKQLFQVASQTNTKPAKFWKVNLKVFLKVKFICILACSFWQSLILQQLDYILFRLVLAAN